MPQLSLCGEITTVEMLLCIRRGETGKTKREPAGSGRNQNKGGVVRTFLLGEANRGDAPVMTAKREKASKKIS